MSELAKAANIALKDCMAVNSDETVLVVTDPLRRKIGLALFDEALKLANEAFLLEMKAREINGEEPPRPIAVECHEQFAEANCGNDENGRCRPVPYQQISNPYQRPPGSL